MTFGPVGRCFVMSHTNRVSLCYIQIGTGVREGSDTRLAIWL